MNTGVTAEGETGRQTEDDVRGWKTGLRYHLPPVTYLSDWENDRKRREVWQTGDSPASILWHHWNVFLFCDFRWEQRYLYLTPVFCDTFRNIINNTVTIEDKTLLISIGSAGLQNRFWSSAASSSWRLFIVSVTGSVPRFFFTASHCTTNRKRTGLIFSK